MQMSTPHQPSRRCNPIGARSVRRRNRISRKILPTIMSHSLHEAEKKPIPTPTARTRNHLPQLNHYHRHRLTRHMSAWRQNHRQQAQPLRARTPRAISATRQMRQIGNPRARLVVRLAVRRAPTIVVKLRARRFRVRPVRPTFVA